MFTSNKQLVVTAMGTDRTGIVSELTKLVTESNLNILDSRMAILGSEFSFIMLLAGDMASVSRFEFKLPALSQELDLITMLKHTTPRQQGEVLASYEISYKGQDRVGALSTLARFLAERKVDISSLKTDTSKEDEQDMMYGTLLVNIREGLDLDEFKQQFELQCHQLRIDYTMKRLK